MGKLWISVVLSISGLGVTIVGVVLPIYIDFIRPYAHYILAFGIFLIVGPWLLMFVYFLKKKKQLIKQPIKNFENLKTIFGKITDLHTRTGLLIQDSFNAPIAVIGGKFQSLHKDFQDFTEYIGTITLSVPQEAGVKVMSFFDLLFDYKKQADVMINSSKTKECYARWMNLRQTYEEIVAPRYTELEVYLRNILNEKDLT